MTRLKNYTYQSVPLTIQNASGHRHHSSFLRSQSIAEGVLFQLIEKPLITEKTTRQNEHHTYAFLVNKNATKRDVSLALKEIYKVDVKKVNIVRTDGKKKISRGRIGYRSETKKAFVRFAQSIDVFVMSS